uniref:Uncharacterized protein n=1 Tax=Arundo donax TaxID=35708 RepID=A0A0A9BPT4_ARUDO
MFLSSNLFVASTSSASVKIENAEPCFKLISCSSSIPPCFWKYFCLIFANFFLSRIRHVQVMAMTTITTPTLGPTTSTTVLECDELGGFSFGHQKFPGVLMQCPGHGRGTLTTHSSISWHPLGR